MKSTSYMQDSSSCSINSLRFQNNQSWFRSDYKMNNTQLVSSLTHKKQNQSMQLITIQQLRIYDIDTIVKHKVLIGQTWF